MSDRYVSVALPQLPDNRTFISDEMLKQDHSLQDFVSRGHNYWEYSMLMSMWLSPIAELKGQDDE